MKIVSSIENLIGLSTPALLLLIVGAVILLGVAAIFIVKAKRDKSVKQTIVWRADPEVKQEEKKEFDFEGEEDDAAETEETDETEDSDDEDEGKQLYKRSYFSKVIQADDGLKDIYNDLKNYIMSYPGVRFHISWFYEAFYVTKLNFVRLIFKGKTLCMCIAIDHSLCNADYKVEDMSRSSKFKDVPSLLRIRNPKNCREAKELVATFFSLNHIEQAEHKQENFKPAYLTDEQLLSQNLVKPLAALADKEDVDIDAENDVELPENDDVEIYLDDEGNVIEISFKRSFTARLIQADSVVKKRYSAIKNALLSNEQVTAKTSWANETFFCGDKKIARINVRGSRLFLYLALPVPEQEGKFPIRDASAVRAYADIPLLLIVKKDTAARHGIHLINKLFAENGLVRHRVKNDYDCDYENTIDLYKKGLVKFSDKTQEQEYLEKWDKEYLEKKIFDAHRDYFTQLKNDFALQGKLTVDDNVKLRRSYTAKLVQAEIKVKDAYNQIKNKILRIKGVSDRVLWSAEKFSVKTMPIAFIVARDKSLKLCLALRPASFKKEVYHQTNVGKTKKFEPTPLCVSVSGKRSVKRALELIDAMVEKLGLTTTDKPETDFYEFYQTDGELLQKGLIKESTATSKAAPKFKSFTDVYGDDAYLKKSFSAKLIQSRADVKKAYAEVCAELNAYKKIKHKLLWGSETWTYHKTLMARMTFKKQRLVVFFAADPSDKRLKKLHFENRSRFASCQKTPVMARIDRYSDVDNVKSVVSVAFADLEKGEVTLAEKSTKREGTFTLIDKGLIKVGHFDKTVFSGKLPQKKQ